MGNKKTRTDSLKAVIGSLVIVGVLVLLVLGLVVIRTLPAVLTPSTPTPEVEEDRITLNIWDGRNYDNLTNTTNVWIYETHNISDFSNYTKSYFNVKADTINFTLNASVHYVIAYNQSGYFTRWAVLDNGTNDLYLYRNPTTGNLFCNAYERSAYGTWNGITDVNLSVIVGWGIQDEIDFDRELYPCYDYQQANYTFVVLNFTMNRTMTTETIDLLSENGYNLVEGDDYYTWNTSANIFFAYTWTDKPSTWGDTRLIAQIS